MTCRIGNKCAQDPFLSEIHKGMSLFYHRYLLFWPDKYGLSVSHPPTRLMACSLSWVSSCALEAGHLYHVSSFPNSNVKLNLGLFVGSNVQLLHISWYYTQIRIRTTESSRSLWIIFMLHVTNSALRWRLFTIKFQFIYRCLWLLMPIFEITLQRTRALCVDCLSSYMCWTAICVGRQAL